MRDTSFSANAFSRRTAEKRFTTFKIFSDIRLVKDTVIINDSEDMNRTRKVFEALTSACNYFDISEPIWLEKSITDFKRYDKVRFYQDNFIEHIDFDFLEMHVIEED